jgi:hypothetical protein
LSTLAVAIATTLVAALVALAVHDEGGSSATARRTPPSDVSGSTTTVVVTTTTIAVQGLDALLIEDVPPGFSLLPDGATNGGPVALDDAAKLEDDPARERELLMRTGFSRGHLRTWATVEGDVIVVFVYEFGDEVGAERYRQAEVAALEADGNADRFTVREVPGGTGFTQTAEEDGAEFHLQMVLFRKGPRVFLVVVGAEEPRHRPAEVRALARAQFEKA